MTSDNLATVIGASGFVGSHLAARLRTLGFDVFCPEKGAPSVFDRPLGHVFYCAGITSDFRSRPYDAVEAHTGYISRLLQAADFRSLLYLSTTRLYHQAESTREEANLSVNSNQREDIYALSKLLGESVCLCSGRSNVRVARLSNVVGDDFRSGNFIYSVMKDILEHGSVTLLSTMDSEKDYIRVEDAVEALIQIALSGKQFIYNVASGVNLTNQQLFDAWSEVRSFDLTLSPAAVRLVFKPIQITRMQEEFDFRPASCLTAIQRLLTGRSAKT
ncbi:NAD-dependent epimerase/dehydratase family protein [Paenibacillus sp. JDR-2]|uniref:NAD-dependent epimerase/dehydratase family protein n=1 Tax=Paenibacillus sp. (strain JDR-2) TaxID=324057 RepID=UPI000166B75A|nr:SDR family oxidoreductase [Paenibacillus sp. JDR-2]ACT02477.1 NAD-dependent epimerase/dehydratase [Paenibacillus sp. JDR-2]